MKVFVTGGSGFLGQAVLRRLNDDGHDVLALVRSEASARKVLAHGAHAVAGDIDQVDDFAASLQGIEAVVHCAAPVEFWGPWSKYQRGIVDATRTLAEACQAQGVRRFVYISSESVLQDRADLVDIDESLPYPEQPNSFYGQAKKQAEQELLSLTGTMDRIILRPTFIWGPHCPAFATLGEKVQSGQFMWIAGACRLPVQYG